MRQALARAKEFLAEISTLLEQKLNLTALVMTVVYYAFTHNSAIWIYFLILEIWYLWFSARQGPLILLRNWLRNQLPEWSQKLKWQAIFSELLLMGGVIYVVLMRGPGVVIAGRSFDSVSERWEVAALIWNFAYVTLSYLRVPAEQHVWRNIVASLRFMCALWLTMRALGSLAQDDQGLHVKYVVALAICYLVTGGLDILFFYRKKPSELKRSKKTSLYIDSPAVVMLVVIWVFTRADAGWTKAFWGGVLACQFVMSFVVNVVIEGRISDAWPPTASRQPLQVSAVQKNPGVGDA